MATTETLDFAPNYCHVIELDVAQSATEHDWRYALRGITSAQPSSDETTNDDTYYHNLGMTETDVEQVKASIDLSGHRMYGDPVQDFVQSLALKTGNDRRTFFRWTMPDGEFLEGSCTLTNIVLGSGMGDANAKGDFSFTIAINEVTAHEYGDKTSVPESVDASDVSVAVGATASAAATVTPSTANQKCHYAVEDTSVATVDADGVVTGVAAGETRLSVKAASKPSVVKVVTVTVTAAA
jgi:hypothetical protein